MWRVVNEIKIFAPSHAIRLSMSVNAKQLEQPDFQSDPSRCKSAHGYHFISDFGYTIYNSFVVLESLLQSSIVNQKS